MLFLKDEGTFQRWPLLLVGQHGALQEYPCPGDRSVFRDKVQGGRMCPWDLMFMLLDFRAFLYRDDLGFACPSVPTEIPLEPCATLRELCRPICSALKPERAILKLRWHNLI